MFILLYLSSFNGIYVHLWSDFCCFLTYYFSDSIKSIIAQYFVHWLTWIYCIMFVYFKTSFFFFWWITSYILNVTTGVYTCVAENCVGTTQCGAELRVLAHGDPSDTDLRPPVFLEGLPPELKTEEGQPLELQTRIQGTPLSTRLWSFRVINKLIICVMLSSLSIHVLSIPVVFNQWVANIFLVGRGRKFRSW